MGNSFTHSFYESHQKKYTNKELQRYRDLTGMPLFDSYEELMAALKDDRKDGKKNSHSTSIVYQKKRGGKI
ncbi:MAG: hypothetical protein HFJ12_06660 [Bacilli bacterium]|nr:hypothetical protein [Bacilli bacterium]